MIFRVMPLFQQKEHGAYHESISWCQIVNIFDITSLFLDKGYDKTQYTYKNDQVFFFGRINDFFKEISEEKIEYPTAKYIIP